MTHRSRLGVIVIDCQTADLGPATAFWANALGVSGEVDPDGKYAVLADRQGYPKVLLQSVEHESRVHLDIETDDQAAECARLEALGATVVSHTKRWIVMEAPTGHRFCLVKPQGDDFPGDAAVWGAYK
ncbi:MAG: VOC family protein [Pseudomonadota bacterium]